MSLLRLTLAAALATTLAAGPAVAAPKWARPDADAKTLKSDNRLCRKIAGRMSSGYFADPRLVRQQVYVPHQIGLTWETQSADVNSMATQTRYRDSFMSELGRARAEEVYFKQCMTKLGYSPLQAD